MYKIKIEKLPALFQSIACTQRLYLPIKQGGQVNFDSFDEKKEIDFTEVNTVKSPKELFFPAGEDLYSCQDIAGKISLSPKEYEKGAFVVFGVRSCDIRALEVLDRVFLVSPKDSYYAARREAGTIISLACQSPDTTCFCNAFSIDPTNPGADVDTWIVGEELYWEARSDKGETLTKVLGELLEVAQCFDEEQVKKQKEEVWSIVDRLPLGKIFLSGWGEKAQKTRFESEVWGTLSKTCLACGTCTFICPTCQCYDIKDYNTGHEVIRYRCWDSCMYSDFTMMAHGNNRTTQMQRFRQRFMHKLCYYPANNEGVYACVGCGRCVAKCPSSLHIAKVVKEFEKEEVSQ